MDIQDGPVFTKPIKNVARLAQNYDVESMIYLSKYGVFFEASCLNVCEIIVNLFGVALKKACEA